MAKYTDKQALDELKRLIDEIDNVRKKPRLSPKFKSWKAKTSELLEKLFGRNSRQVKDFDKIPYSLAAFSNQTPDSKFDEAFQQGLKTAAITLSSAVKEIQSGAFGGKSKPVAASSTASPAPQEEPAQETNDNDELSELTAMAAAFSQVSPEIDKPKNATVTSVALDSKKILVFTSGEKNVSSEVTVFLSKIGLSPVSVSKNINQHDEMFSLIARNRDAAYAVVVLGSDKTNSNNETAYGLGLLVGAMGQDKVSVVVNNKMMGIDTYTGVTYVPVDPAGAWKFMMIRNLKTAGFDVDANLAL